MARKFRIGVVAPSSAMHADIPAEIQAVVDRLYPDGRVEIVFDPQCFLRHGHFAGDDEARTEAFARVANDETLDALWFGRGGYGSCRLADRLFERLGPAAGRKTYLGYSDAGALLGGLYRRGIGRVAHGPVVHDIRRSKGEAAIARALAFLVDGDRSALEPNCRPDVKSAAFNMIVLSQLLGTDLQPDLTGHVLMLEEVSEYMYRIDRTMFHLTSHPEIRKVAGIRLGRCSDIPPNDVDFGMDEEQLTRVWCARSGIPYLGRADIGHDADNRIVPFGDWA